MSAPFKVGDVVVCVNATRKRIGRGMAPVSSWLERGKVYRVSAVVDTRDGPALNVEGIKFLEDPDFNGWAPVRFRHLPKADDSFTEQMRSLRPVREDAPDLLDPSYRPWLNHTSEGLRTRWSNQSVYLNRETRS